jgi:malate dehydrogenase (decarboxylating)
MQAQGATPEAAHRNFHILDAAGLITSKRAGLADHVKPFARPAAADGGYEGQGLLDVVRRVKPDALLGLAGAGRLFTRDVLEAAGEGCARPVIFPMSNPTAKMECTAKEAVEATDNRCIFASGSPQAAFEYGGVRREFSQANNLYVFPGVALGAYLGQTGAVTDRMLMAAAEELPRLIWDGDLEAGLVFPRIKSIRQISADVAVAVMRAAAADGHLHAPGAARALEEGGESGLQRWVFSQMYSPEAYAPLAYLPPGIGE